MDFKITVINMLKDIMGKVDNIHEQMGNFRREIKTIRKSQTNC